MKVVVLGGGVIGVCTAYYLARGGAEVTVVEREQWVAEETSYANAGQVSPGYSTPWAAPGIPLKAAKWLFEKHAPLAVRLDGSSFQLRWMWQMYRNCNPRSYEVNKERMTRVAEYSRDCLDGIREETGIHYEQRTSGTLQVFRTDKQMQAVQRDIRVLEECNVPHHFITSADGLVEYEPALASAKGLIGGLQLPGDETGDCHMFTLALAEIAKSMGVDLRLGTRVERILTEGDRVSGLQLQGGETLLADAYVTALGVYSREMLKPLGLKLPVYPVKGYSLTVPIVDPEQAPRSTVMDESYKVAITRFDKRIRVGGMAELAGFDHKLNPRRRETLEMVLTNLYSGGDVGKATFWTGLRPMTPDGTPIIGPTRYKNLSINNGHGTLGWTMAAGSGKLVADLVLGNTPDISTEGLAIGRYG